MSKPTILLADDDAALLQTVQKLLQPEFIVVASVGDGEALLEAAQAHRPDLIIADITMPLLNGLQAARRLKETQPDARILFLTVHEDHAFVAAAKKIGALGYVIKRCAASRLIPAIHRVLQGDSFVSPVGLE